ncbi:iron ABC transporter [Actinophytocola xinjiangensis]|uniref:Iron ABC transporter n=1 Tax=Actinophytocola xinjiangensis TaxID=485602 RepID=A0A7Z0WJM7_9PSEU|nr:iron chelate uptake ABC transporter family permease subunit [Actinophytocola xinjiangensis]OLF06694.1 iron ABC transporter [Actinophytocola xinjiangensis]
MALEVVVRTRRAGRARASAVCLTLAVLCFAVLCVSLALGDVTIPVFDVVATLFGGGDAGAGYIVTELRLPRGLVAVLAGAAFGLSGAIFQSLTRNSLASPDIIGITAGASAAAVVALLVFNVRGAGVSLAALAGALGSAAVIYAVAWRGGVSGYRFVLSGVAMAAMLTSVVSYCLTRVEVHLARDALAWLTGSLNAKSWDTATTLGIGVAILAPAALVAGRWLTALQVGDDLARVQGVHVERARLGLLAVAVALAAVATAAVGPVAFVAFVAGPIARRLAGGGGPGLVPAALVGALVMTAADVVGQHAIAGTQFPVGVVTAIIGGPYLLWLLVITNRVGRGD